MKDNKITTVIFFLLSTFFVNFIIGQYKSILNKSNSAVMVEMFDKAGVSAQPASTDHRTGTFGKVLNREGKDILNVDDIQFFADQPIGKFFVWPDYEGLEVDEKDTNKGFVITKNNNPNPSHLVINKLRVNNNANTIKNETGQPKWVWLFDKKNQYIGSWPTPLAAGETRKFDTDGKILGTVVITSNPVETKLADTSQNNLKGFVINKDNKVEPLQQTLKQQSENPSDLSIMTLNCYAFSEAKNEALKNITFGETCLLCGVGKNVRQRLDEIGVFVNLHEPDVFVAQEVWGTTNKDALKYAINTIGKGNYDIRYASGDDGLIIASKRPIDFFESITFKHKRGDETFASKGAIFAGFKDNSNRPVIVVNTHLQSQTFWGDIVIRHNQMYQLGEKLASILKNRQDYKDARIFVVGDFNEPIYFQDSFSYKEKEADKFKIVTTGGKTLFDRAQYLVDTLAFALKNENDKYKISNKDVIKFLADKYKPDQTLLIGEYKTEKPEERSQVTITRGGISKNLDLLHLGYEKDYIGALNEKFRDWDSDRAQRYYFKDATDPSGTQLLDHFFADKNNRLVNYVTFRNELLGDQSTQLIEKFPSNFGQKSFDAEREAFKRKFFNAKRAMSDHAAVMATFRAQTVE